MQKRRWSKLRIYKAGGELIDESVPKEGEGGVNQGYIRNGLSY